MLLAYYAANEMSKEITFPANRYEYLNSFAPDPNHTTKAASWYDAGTEIIFACEVEHETQFSLPLKVNRQMGYW